MSTHASLIFIVIRLKRLHQITGLAAGLRPAVRSLTPSLKPSEQDKQDIKSWHEWIREALQEFYFKAAAGMLLSYTGSHWVRLMEAPPRGNLYSACTNICFLAVKPCRGSRSLVQCSEFTLSLFLSVWCSATSCSGSAVSCTMCCVC